MFLPITFSCCPPGLTAPSPLEWLAQCLFNSISWEHSGSSVVLELPRFKQEFASGGIGCIICLKAWCNYWLQNTASFFCSSTRPFRHKKGRKLRGGCQMKRDWDGRLDWLCIQLAARAESLIIMCICYKEWKTCFISGPGSISISCLNAGPKTSHLGTKIGGHVKQKEVEMVASCKIHSVRAEIS